MFLKIFFLTILSLSCSYQEKDISNFQSFILEEWQYKKPFPESKFYVFGKHMYLHFREFKPKQKAIGKILLVHGFAGNTYSFRKNISTLLELNYLVIAVDLPNFGYSARIPSWDHSNEFRAKFLWSFLDFYENHNQLSKDKWVILGHSMGGVVAAYMAQLNQNKTERLILVAPALGQKPSSILSAIIYFPFVEQITKSWIQATLSNKERFAKILQSAYGIAPFYPAEEDIEGYRKPLLQENTIDYSLDLIRNSKSETSLVLKNILLPIYIIHGLHDSWVNLLNVMRQVESISNVKLIVYSNVGHCPMETNAEEFNKDLKIILKD